MASDKMTLEDWLDELCVRFIINLPREDLSSVARICFQIEEAQWFYEDFIRPLDPTLPSMSLRSFSLRMFQHCPLLASFSAESHIKAFDEFLQYKTRVPVRGAVMLNDNMDAAVLVRGWKKGASWSFPRGKINKDEDDLDCAIREVYEETGFDLRTSGLVEKNEPVHALNVTMQEQQVRLYVFRGIPTDTIFATRTRKEIGDIQWYRVEDLPAYRKKKASGKGVEGPSKEKFYMVAPFMVQLRQWVVKQRAEDAYKVANSAHHAHLQTFQENHPADEILHESSQREPTPETYPEFMDSATKELQRLLKVKPPTHGLQLQTPSSSQHAGQALMSLLQPKATSQLMSEQDQGKLKSRYGHAPKVATETDYSHRRPHLEHDAFSYGAPVQSSNEGPPKAGYLPQHRGRPFVDVSTEVPNQPGFPGPLHQLRNQPSIQLVHPQPLPPQVQKAMLLRGMIASPQIAEPQERHRVNQHASHVPQTHPHGSYGIHPETMSGTQLPAQSANLLNILKGSTAARANTGQRLDPGRPQQIASIQKPSPPSPQGHHQAQIPSTGNGVASQYGASAIPPPHDSMPGNSRQTSLLSSNMRVTRPTDTHRAGLLDMFKSAASSDSHNQLAGEGEQRQRGDEASTASTLRTAARENGRPVVMNPETNLPYGAVRILSRSQAMESFTDNTTTSVRTTTNNARHSAKGSAPSPILSVNKSSPSLAKAPSRSHQLPPKNMQQSGQPSPRSHVASMQTYPYGNAQPNPLSLFPSPPSASALPIPSGIRVRQDQTAEQRNALLSLFGKPKASFEQSMGKGKEPAMADQFVAGAASRSRLGSVASSGGDGMGGLRGNSSRRGSQAPLSPADRDFLMNFLESQSNNVKTNSLRR
ncbi:hypothetical protein GGR54DRAFT_591670 [Hypoxylon sp. NC1633]|nr:hypothetical protein GGR54DRAFT_591670 [Hypoxylon sp. NC1633]